jgi:hypothetical protein
MPVCKGDAILIPTGDKKHLFIVIAGPSVPPPHPSQALLVPICTYENKPSQDPTCLLNVGDHSFLKAASYAAYSQSRLESTNAIDTYITNGQFMLHDRFQTAVLQRVIDGLALSDRTKPFALDFFNAQ